MRAAAPACIGLGMETAVQRVIVLGLALGAHREYGHRGLRTVIWNAPSNGEAGSAVGAVEKWIAVAAIIWIKKLAKTVGAGGCIRGNASADATMNLTGDDAKSRFPRDVQILSQDRIDPGKWRCFRGEPVKK